MEVVEFWPEERAFMFDTCCEDLQNGLIAALQDAMTLPFQQRTAYLKEIRAAFSLDGLPFRQVYDEWPGGGLRLDLGLSTPPSVVDAPISPIPFDEAMAFIEEHHEHNGRLPGWKWGHGLYNGSDLIGVAVVGRPRARHLNRTVNHPHRPNLLEVNRVCVRRDINPALTWNACSKLYGICVREAKRRNRTDVDPIERLITYTLKSEAGTSLKAAGWELESSSRGGSWSSPSRPRTTPTPTAPKWRWTYRLTPAVQPLLL